MSFLPLLLLPVAWAGSVRAAGAESWVVETRSPAATDALVALGCIVEVSTPTALQVRCATATDLRAVPGVTHLRAPFVAHAKDEGLVVSEGYGETVAADWRTEGITGHHVKVAVLDVGFAGWEDLLGTELPAHVETNFSLGNVDSSSHGTAVAEVIHDFAPDAELELVTFATDVEFTLALNTLAAEGVDVVNGSIGFDNVWAADGTSLASSAVTSARDAGVIYVAAAGNENQKYISGNLTRGPGASVLLGERWGHTILTRSGFASVSLRWSEPFGQAATDLDLALFDETGAECGRAERVQDGDGDPFESVSTGECDGETVLATLQLKDPHQSTLGLRAWLYSDYGVDPAEAADRDTLTLPADAEGAFSVGGYEEDGSLAEWSSHGPTDDGRLKPDAVGPTGVSTATFGPLAFEGSSASAPHASGLAALWLDATHRWRDPEGFREWAWAGATDLGADGADTGSGAGALRAGGIPERECGCASAGETYPALSIVLIAAGYGARRRR